MSMPPTPHMPPDDTTESSTAQSLEAPASPPSRDATFWAETVSTLKVSGMPAGVVALNVDGKRVVSPLQGFGQMWQKTYRVRLNGANVTPQEVIRVWKAEFPTFWPKGNRFYVPLTGIAPGEVAVLNLAVGGGMRLSTGVLVLYADDESFTLMTPQGHMFAGWITFSSREEGGVTIAQAEVLIRANDPLYELGMRLGGFRQEDRFWKHTLQAVAERFGVHDARVEMRIVCVDPRLQWNEARNIWQNAAVRTTLYTLSAPVRWVRRQRSRAEAEQDT